LHRAIDRREDVAMLSLGICRQENDPPIRLGEAFAYSEVPLSFFETPWRMGQAPRDTATTITPPAALVLGCFPRGTELYSGPHAVAAARARSAEVAVILAQTGVSGLGFGAGAVRAIPRHVSRADGEAQIAAVLRDLDACCATAGITLHLENLPANETNLFNTVAEIVAFLERYGLERVRIVFDLRAALAEGDDPLAALAWLDWIGHVHVPAHLDEATGLRRLDFVEALIGAGYRGRVSVEAYPRALDEAAVAFGRELGALLRRIEAPATLAAR
jgi:sugar phosphate isomerase/epimerase